MPTEHLYNETTLVNAMHTGDPEAFTKLYLHYSPQLYQNILYLVHDKTIAEEIVQELFTRIWQKRNYKGIKENFRGYMYQVARNLVHDFFRKLKRDKKLLEKFQSVAVIEENTEDLLDHRQSSAILRHAIEQLPPQQKKVFKLVKEEGYTYKKAADSLGISPFTVKEYLVSAKKSIRKYMLSHLNTSIETMLIIAICCYFF